MTLIVAIIAVNFPIEKTTPVDQSISENELSSMESSELISSENSSEISSEVSSEPISSKEVSSNNKKTNIPSSFTKEEKETLDQFISSFEGKVSVFFKDINSKNIYCYNEEEKYFIASIVKAPYCMYLYDLASKGKFDLEKEYTIEKEDVQEGTGKINKLEEIDFPLNITARELIRYSIAYSDNTAVEILRKEYNHIGYTQYAKKLGIHYPKDIKSIVNGDVTAKDAGVYIEAIYHFINTNKYGEELKKDMMSTTNRMIYSKYDIARKYGWAEKSFHDMAIVYAENPYLLVILSDHDEGKKEDYEMFYKISTTIEKMQTKKYDEVNN